MNTRTKGQFVESVHNGYLSASKYSSGIYFVNIHQDQVKMSLYPNPANPSTTIQVQFPEDGSYSIHLFDINGHKLNTLENGFFKAGQKSFNVDVSAYSSGVYFIQIENNVKHISQKLFIVK